MKEQACSKKNLLIQKQELGTDNSLLQQEPTGQMEILLTMLLLFGIKSSPLTWMAQAGLNILRMDPRTFGLLRKDTIPDQTKKLWRMPLTRPKEEMTSFLTNRTSNSTQEKMISSGNKNPLREQMFTELSSWITSVLLSLVVIETKLILTHATTSVTHGSKSVVQQFRWEDEVLARNTSIPASTTLLLVTMLTPKLVIWISPWNVMILGPDQ